MSGSAYASAVVTPLADGSQASASALVNMLLGAQSGVSVVGGSQQYVGAASASGTFTNGGLDSFGLGIDRGVVLTSGDARFIGSSAAFAFDSANKAPDFTAGVGNPLTPNTSPGNALFAGMTSFGTQNASILSFDFVPTYGTLTLSFVFGSEDYGDFHAADLTDRFGVFVNGVNQALVNGVAISAATVNCDGSPNCSLYRDNPPFFDSIDSELDGMTVLLNLRMNVNAGVVNSISIGIADGFDTGSDSAVMLQQGSLAAVPEPSTVALMSLGVVGLALAQRRRRGAVPQAAA